MPLFFRSIPGLFTVRVRPRGEAFAFDRERISRRSTLSLVSTPQTYTRILERAEADGRLFTDISLSVREQIIRRPGEAIRLDLGAVPQLVEAFISFFGFQSLRHGCVIRNIHRSRFQAVRAAEEMRNALRRECPVETGAARASIGAGARFPPSAPFVRRVEIWEGIDFSAWSRVDYMEYIADPWFDEIFATYAAIASAAVAESIVSGLRRCAFQ